MRQCRSCGGNCGGGYGSKPCKASICNREGWWPHTVADAKECIELQDERFVELEAELNLYRNGYKGGCYACETVGEKNVELEADNEALIHAFGHWHVRSDDGDACGKCGLDLRNPIHWPVHEDGDHKHMEFDPGHGQ